jgi:hypothetical protein
MTSPAAIWLATESGSRRMMSLMKCAAKIPFSLKRLLKKVW